MAVKLPSRPTGAAPAAPVELAPLPAVPVDTAMAAFTPPAGVTVGAASVVAMYGPTKTRKTTQIRELAMWVFEKTQKKTLVFCFEPASGWDIIRPAVEAGLIIPVIYNPTVLNSQGVRAMNPLTMVQFCLEGRLKWTGSGFVKFTPQEWSEIGAVAFDTLDTWGDEIMNMLAKQGAKVAAEEDGKGKGKGSGLSSPGWEDEHGVTHGFSSPGHFGKAGSDLVQFLQRFPSTVYTESQGNVKYVIYSFHEANKEKEDADARAGKKKVAAVYGPELVGRAAVSKVGSSTGMLLHLVLAATPDGKPTVWAYYESHPSEDPRNPYPASARTSASPEDLAALASRYPDGWFDMGKTSIAEFVDFVEHLGSRTADMIRIRMTQALKRLEAPTAAEVTETETPTNKESEQQ